MTHEIDPYEDTLESEENFPAWIGLLILFFMALINMADMFNIKKS